MKDKKLGRCFKITTTSSSTVTFTRGRDFQLRGKLNLQEFMARTRCRKCNQKGHSERNCPQKRNATTPRSGSPAQATTIVEVMPTPSTEAALTAADDRDPEAPYGAPELPPVALPCLVADQVAMDSAVNRTLGGPLEKHRAHSRWCRCLATTGVHQGGSRLLGARAKPSER